MGFLTDIHTQNQIQQWNNAKIGKNETFHIHVKSEHGYSPKYPEHVFSVIGLSLCRHGHDHKMRQITKCDGKDSWNCRNMWLSHFVTVQNATSQIHVRSARGYTAQCRKQCTHRRRTLSIRFPLQIDYGLYNWYTYTQTDITVKLRQNGQKWNFSYSCQKWTWVLSQVPRTRFQCYWTQFVPSRPWSQNATNHKMRRQGFLNCRNMWLLHFVTVQNATSQIRVRSARGYTPQYRKHVHIDVGHYQ